MTMHVVLDFTLPERAYTSYGASKDWRSIQAAVGNARGNLDCALGCEQFDFVKARLAVESALLKLEIARRLLENYSEPSPQYLPRAEAST